MTARASLFTDREGQVYRCVPNMNISGRFVSMIILITASLSSNTYNKTSWREDWTIEGTESMSFITSIRLWDLWCFLTSLSGCPDRSETWETLPETETIRSHKSRAGIPSNLNPASKEMISDSVELCETEVCFLHIQLMGTIVWLQKMHNVPPDVDFESSRSPAKSESWKSPSLHCLAVSPTWQYCLYSQVWWIFEINRVRRLSQALVHFVIDRASLFTDHKISGRPILANYKQIRTIWENTFDNSPTDFNSSSLIWWSSIHGDDTLYSCWVVLFANSQYRSTHFLAWPSMSQDHEEIRTMSYSFRFLIEYIPVNVVKKWCSFIKINMFQQYFPHPIDFLFLPVNLMSYTYTDKNNPFSRCTNKHSQFGIFLPTMFQYDFLKLPFP